MAIHIPQPAIDTGRVRALARTSKAVLRRLAQRSRPRGADVFTREGIYSIKNVQQLEGEGVAADA